MKSKKKVTIILVLISIIGLSLLLYPSISNYVNAMNQSRAIASYVENVANLDSDEYERILVDAQEYNQSLVNRVRRYHLNEEQAKEYPNMLRTSGTDVMGYIEIAKIDCYLPIYHGTDEAILAVAAGHVEWSSLPIGGISSHCVISGHRGLPSARLFTELDQMEIGDTFIIRVLDQILTYEVDQILIVEPDDVSALTIEPGKDYCTLVTCTPYGVNSHRILVRGHRIENMKEANSIRVSSDAIQMEPLIIAPLVSVPIFVLILILVFAQGKKSKNRKSEKNGGTINE